MKPPDTILLPIDTRNCPLEAFSYINQFALHKPSNEHAAPTELGEGPRVVGGYRHGAPTELFKSVQCPSAHAKQKEALHEPRTAAVSETSRSMVHGPNAWATRNVSFHDRTVILLHVVNLNVVPPDGRVFDDLSRAAEKNLLRLSERFLEPGFFVSHKIRFGRPAVEILNEAKESNVDLVTLTSHGSGTFWKRCIRPRIVEKVLRAAPCDVMLLHVRTRFNCDEDWERADEIVSTIEHAGLLPGQAQPQSEFQAH